MPEILVSGKHADQCPPPRCSALVGFVKLSDGLILRGVGGRHATRRRIHADRGSRGISRYLPKHAPKLGAFRQGQGVSASGQQLPALQAGRTATPVVQDRAGCISESESNTETKTEVDRRDEQLRERSTRNIDGTNEWAKPRTGRP